MMSKYTSLIDVPGVLGYIVNVHDAVNYDIDLFLDDALRKRYWNVITNTYTYQDMADETQSKNTKWLNNLQIGTTYRCRLKGIGVIHQTPDKQRPYYGDKQKKPKKKHYDYVMRDAHIAMIRQFDRQNGWVVCTISDVDVYRRLLVTLYDPITGNDLSDILKGSDYRDHFRPYNTRDLDDFPLPQSEIF